MKMFTRKSEGKRLLELSEHRCKDNTKKNLKTIRYEGMDCMELNQDRPQGRVLLNPVMNFLVP
jgi:hypothetical protein